MSGTSFLRVKKLKGAGIVLAAARHNKRTIAAEIGASGSIDPARIGMNVSLLGDMSPEAIDTQAKALMAQADIPTLRKDAVRALEFVFSLAPDSGTDVTTYFAACAEWVCARFPGHLQSADVHLDEGAPHCHVLFLPLVNGRMVGSDLLGGRPQFQAMHADFIAKVAERHGLKRVPKLVGETKTKAAAVVLAKLRQVHDPVLLSALWGEVRERIEADPGPFVLALGIVVNARKPKRAKTMAEVFTSTGRATADDKHSRKSRKNPIGFAVDSKPNPIGFDAQTDANPIGGKQRTLCSVGFGFSELPETTQKVVDSHVVVDVPVSVTRRALKLLRSLPVGVDDERLVMSACAAGVSRQDLGEWLGDVDRVAAILGTGLDVGWRYLFEFELEDFA